MCTKEGNLRIIFLNFAANNSCTYCSLFLIFFRDIAGLEVKGFNQLRGAYAKESTFLISRFRNKVQYEGPDLVN